MKYKNQMEDLSRRVRPCLHNGGVIVHPPETTQSEQADLFAKYPSAIGYHHVVLAFAESASVED